MHKIGFYYQVWFENQRSIFESLKQLRKIYPKESLFVVVAGVKSSDIELFSNQFGNRLVEHFKIDKLDFIYSDRTPSMPTVAWRFKQLGINPRDGFNEFNNVWIEKLVETVDKDIEILVNCSDDWYPLKEFNISLEHDISCRLQDWPEWANRLALEKYLKVNNDQLPWMQHGHYFNYQKFLSSFTEENKKLINNAIKEVYDQDQLIFLDFFHALWNMVVFETFESSPHICESKKDPYEACLHDNRETFHGYAGFRKKRFSEEMIELGFKEFYE